MVHKLKGMGYVHNKSEQAMHQICKQEIVEVDREILE